MDVNVSGLTTPNMLFLFYCIFCAFSLIGVIYFARRAGVEFDDDNEGKGGSFVAAAIAFGLLMLGSGIMSLSMAWDLFEAGFPKGAVS